jgi:hypothetical protein
MPNRISKTSSHSFGIVTSERSKGKREEVVGKKSLHTAGGPTGYTCKEMFETKQELLLTLCVDHFVMHMELFPLFTVVIFNISI